MTVAVVEKLTAQTVFNRNDVEIEWFSGTGCGGQYRNKHQNSCRAIHTPTGIVAKAECRSRRNSEEVAIAELKRRVEGSAGEKHDLAVAQDRRQQVGSGMRGDKVRTYRLQDDTVTDHRTDKRASWRQIERGDFARLA